MGSLIVPSGLIALFALGVIVVCVLPAWSGETLASDKPDDRVVFSVMPSGETVTSANGQVIAGLDIDITEGKTLITDISELQRDQQIRFTGESLAAVTARQGECVIEVTLGWSNQPDAVRSLVDIKFDSGDQVGIAMINDVMQVYGLFGGIYRQAFVRGMKTGSDVPSIRVVLTWSYADGYTLVTLRVNEQDAASIVTGLGQGHVERVTFAGKAGRDRSELEPLGWQLFELASAIRWQPIEPDQPLPVSAKRLQQADGLTLWTEHAARQVRLNQALPDMPTTDALQLSLARGETQATQLVLTADQIMTDVEVTVDPWIHMYEGKWSPATVDGLKLDLLLVENVEVAFASGRYGGTGLWPDPLPPLSEPLTLKPGENRVLWLSVYADRQTMPGVYETTVNLSSQGRQWRVPFQIKVRSFALPKRPTLDTLARLNGRYLTQNHDLYYRNLAAHRINGIVGAQAVETLDNPRFTSAQAQAARDEIDLLVNELGFDYITLTGIGWVSHAGTHRWPNGSHWYGVPHFQSEDSSEIGKRFHHSYSQHLPQVLELLVSEAPLDRFMFFYQDEMSWDDPLTLTRSVNMARYLKQVAPDIQMLQSKYPTSQMMPYVDIWCVHADHATIHREKLEQVQADGQKAWIYHNTIPTIDYPAIRSRLFPWLLWKLDLDGSYSYWSINEWQDDPWTKPWSGIAGSGVLIYPPREQDGPDPVTSIRWEMLRDGLEDVDYLAMLNQAMDQQTLSPGQRERAIALLTQADSMVGKMPQVIGLGDQPYSLDVIQLEQLREGIANLLDEIALQSTKPSEVSP